MWFWRYYAIYISNLSMENCSSICKIGKVRFSNRFDIIQFFWLDLLSMVLSSSHNLDFVLSISSLYQLVSNKLLIIILIIVYRFKSINSSCLYLLSDFQWFEILKFLHHFHLLRISLPSEVTKIRNENNFDHLVFFRIVYYHAICCSRSYTI